jgi:hypothetical protein
MVHGPKMAHIAVPDMGLLKKLGYIRGPFLGIFFFGGYTKLGIFTKFTNVHLRRIGNAPGIPTWPIGPFFNLANRLRTTRYYLA